MVQPFAHIATARQLYEGQLLKDPNIIGVGSSYKVRGGEVTAEPSLTAYVISKVPEAVLAESRRVPPRLAFYSPLDGSNLEVATDVVEVGPIYALGYMGRYRPAPGGVSLGHLAATAGTLGGYVMDRETGDLLVLSNNHVLASQNNCQVGDSILQQAPLDGGGEGDAFAALLRWVPLDFSPWGGNVVDAAVAKPTDAASAKLAILGLGPGPNAAGAAQIGMGVQKSGRTTGHTTGARVVCVDATFWVDYSYTGARRAGFRDVMILLGPPGFCQAGDSGSLILTDEPDPKVTGLLFAANSSGTFSLANHIHHVFNLLDVGLVSAPLEIVRGTPWEARLADLKALRDQVLCPFKEGQKYLSLLARHNMELWSVLRQHPELKEEAVRLVTPPLEALFATGGPQDMAFGGAYFDQVRAFLDRVEPLVSLSLQKTISWVRSQLWRYEDKTIVEILLALKNPRPNPLPPIPWRPDR